MREPSAAQHRADELSKYIPIRREELLLVGQGISASNSSSSEKHIYYVFSTEASWVLRLNSNALGEAEIVATSCLPGDQMANLVPESSSGRMRMCTELQEER